MRKLPAMRVGAPCLRGAGRARAAGDSSRVPVWIQRRDPASRNVFTAGRSLLFIAGVTSRRATGPVDRVAGQRSRTSGITSQAHVVNALFIGEVLLQGSFAPSSS